MADLYNSQAAACSAPSMKKLQEDLGAEDVADNALLRASVQNEMKQSWSGVFPDLNGDPHTADTYTVDELTDAIWVSKLCSNYKDVTCNWGEISRSFWRLASGPMIQRKQGFNVLKKMTQTKKKQVQALLVRVFLSTAHRLVTMLQNVKLQRNKRKQRGKEHSRESDITLLHWQ